MKKIVSYTLIGSSLLLLTACLPGGDGDDISSGDITSTQPITPEGSYTLSCNSVSVSNNTLTASCRSLGGAYKSTKLDNLDYCLSNTRDSGDISNIDGNLNCVPDLPKATGFVFPKSETTINKWIYGKQDNEIYQHGWNIWSGLTTVTGQVDGIAVRAFETWPTRSNMLFRMMNEDAAPQRKLHLEKPRRINSISSSVKKGDGDTSILVSIAYNPPAADHAISNKLFFKSTLDNFLNEGYDEIPNFPNNSITIKPVYKHISKNVANGIYTFPGWPGTPSPAKAFPEPDWGACSYINIKIASSSADDIDVGCKNRSEKNTFALSDFIHHKVTAADADYLSSQVGKTIAVGDYVILLGMHVTSREIKRWTWQTFFWSANKNSPALPSSKSIASLRPDQQLDEAAQHYAMSIAYQMVEPAQPITGGANIIMQGANNLVRSEIAYNPHLEAGFNPSIFQYPRSVYKSGNPLGNNFGVQTNCMACHILASYNPALNYNINQQANRENPYSSDMYISLDDKVFNKTLKLDFAWSILGSLKTDR